MNYILLVCNIILLICIHINVHANPITFDRHTLPICNFEDTVDLTNVHRFTNGSYIYENRLIPADQVAIYDYIEVFDGQRVPYEPHPRACVCQYGICLKFCCHPTKEILNAVGQCQPIEYEIPQSQLYVNVTLKNGWTLRRNVAREFIKLEGLPCPYPYALMPETYKEEEWQIMDDGKLLLVHYDTIVSKNDYCLTPVKTASDEWSLSAMTCPVPNVMSTTTRISNVGAVVSTLFMILTVIVYLAIPDLRRNIYGMFIISCLLSLAIGNSMLAFVSLSEITFPELTCSFIGYVAYFFYESAYIGLSLIGFHLWQSKARQNKGVISADISELGNNSYFPYVLFTCLIAFALTFALMVIQSSNIHNGYKPGIGDEYCWLNVHIWSAFFYFFALNGIIFICAILFTYLAAKTRDSHMDKYDDRKPIVYESSDLMKPQQGRIAYVQDTRRMISIYSLLLLVFLISWFLSISSYLGEMLGLDSDNILLYTSDLANCIEGPLIFLVLVIKPKVMSLLRNK
ncbi:probable G-protein coupled receptor Mth-like 10 [Musca vetustissima]|uniref:probable G-protein coupled receptor Mth-like 10 n=1 Tax=Musca vetustissima TaxID=27455 RepID=UPI002AB7A7C1|nr:probable G-protein coupled receptor Mth-like 10 [Musca vetustissima]